MDKKTIIVLAAIILLALIIRIIPIFTFPQGGLFEPDDYYYLSILEQSHGMTLPLISAFDAHPPAEMGGLYLWALISHNLTGISYFTLLQWLSPIIGSLTVLLVFIFTRQMFDKDENDHLPLFATLIAATSPALLTKTLATNYRGDSFLNLLTLLMLIFLLYAYKNRKDKVKLLGGTAISFTIAYASVYSWSGGMFNFFLFFICGVALIILPFINNFTKEKINVKTLIKTLRNKYVVAVLFIFVVLAVIFAPQPYHLSQNTNIFIGSLANLQPLSSLNWIIETQQYNPMAILVLYTPVLVFGPAIVLFLFLPFAVALGALLYVFWLRKYFNRYSIILAIYLISALYINSIQERFVSLAGIPVAIVMALMLTRKLNENAFEVIIITMIVSFLIIWAFMYSYFWQPVDGMTGNYIATMNWIKTNTPTNATVLTFWTDGSAVEGIANRFSYEDSVAGLSDFSNSTPWFLGQSNTLVQFKPKVDYILVRKFDLNETYGFCIEILNISPFNCNATLTSNGLNITNIKKDNPNFLRLLNGTFPGVTLVFNNSDSKVYRVN